MPLVLRTADARRGAQDDGDQDRLAAPESWRYTAGPVGTAMSHTSVKGTAEGIRSRLNLT